MSDFHGGFFVRAVEAQIAEPIRDALATALRARGIDVTRNYLTFTARSGCPVMHVAVHGEAADGKDQAFFHHTHAELGADVARAAGVEVWAYHYENQVGSESVHAFGPDGATRSTAYGSWDDIFDSLDDIADDDERHERMLAEAPLGVLARALGIDRRLLDMDLAYDTPSVRIELTGGPCVDPVAAYLAAPLRATDHAAAPEARTPDLDGEQGLFFPSWMAEELQAIARRLDTTIGTVAWAAWECAKDELHRTLECYSADGATGAARFSSAPAVVAPAAVVVPRLVPVFAKALPAPPASDGKLLLRLALPARVVGELQELASSRDRSLSWVIQTAFLRVRGRMHHATPGVG